MWKTQYFLVFGKEEGKHKSRKTQATTQKKIINVRDLADAYLANARSRDGTISRRRDRVVDRDLNPARSREREIAVVGLVAENGFGMEDKDQQQHTFLVICFLGFGIFFFFWVWFGLNKSWKDL